MASNLPGNICVGQHSVCIIRAAMLSTDCSVLGGADSGFVTTGIITATASMQLQEGQNFEPQTGCGDIAWTYEQPARLRSVNLSGEIAFFDHEMMVMLFGGSLVTGRGGGPYPGYNIGWAAPNYTDAAPRALYVEFITKTAGKGVGECGSTGGTATFPPYVGHIFGKARFTPGDRTFAAEAATVSFTGTSVSNPNLYDGPWDDWPGTGFIPNSPYVQASYSQAQFDTIAATAGCGYKTLPTNTS